MSRPPAPDLTDVDSVIAGLHRGDFSALDPLFQVAPTDGASLLARWIQEGRLAADRPALNEALTCASFNGRNAWVTYLLERGADLAAGAGTGLNAIHWAANRGQLETVRLLVARGAPLEARNAYGGTVLGAAVWAALHEPRPTHTAIVEALLAAGADAREAEYPSGHPAIDALLEGHRSRG